MADEGSKSLEAQLALETPDDGREDDQDENEGNDSATAESSGQPRLFDMDRLLSSLTDETPPEPVLDSLDIEGVAKKIKEGNCQNIIVMCGAGLSTSAGIPDFRSPGSGLYDNLAQYNLPHPQAIFEIGFFKENPKPFFVLAKNLYPGKFKPTPSHYFLRLLEQKGHLLRVFTQNVDTLEHVAGLSTDVVVEAHGSFRLSHCILCRKEFSQRWMKERIFKDEVPRCTECQGLIKPDIVFFGENLPEKFFNSMSDFSKCDLLLIIGTSLAVQPFASLISMVGKRVPRFLINRDKVGDENPIMEMLHPGSGMQFDSPRNYRDVCWLGDCDEGCRKLAELLDWKDELESLISSEWEKIEKEQGKEPPPPSIQESESSSNFVKKM